MIDLDAARFLASPPGLRALEGLAPGGEIPPPCATPARLEGTRRALGRHAGPALEQLELRWRAQAKFPRAAEMLFTREALEQATAAPVAAHRARRFSGLAPVADVGCGIGGDLLALARVGGVLGLDLDPVRLLFARHNLAIHGVAGRALVARADAARWIPEAGAWFFDPSRRSASGGRIVGLEGISPPLRLIRAVARRQGGDAGIGVKLSPLVRPQGLGDLEGEIEWVSLDGECREAVLWLGRLRTAARRATVLPSGASLAGEPGIPAPLGPPGPYLHDPDPALVASGLLGLFARREGLRVLDRRLAYLAGEHPAGSPLARPYRVLERLPFHLGRLRRRLEARGVGRLEIKKRGFPLAPEELRRRLRPRGGVSMTLLVARVGRRHEAFLAEPLPRRA